MEMAIYESSHFDCNFLGICFFSVSRHWGAFKICCYLWIYPLWSHSKLNLLVQQPNCKDFVMKKRLNHHSRRCAGISRVSNTNGRLYKDWERQLWKISSFTSWNCVPISWAVIDALSSSSFTTVARVVITFYHFLACWRIRSFSKVPFFANPSCCWILQLQVMYIALFRIADLWPSVQVTNESLFS
jgi:hypothetical protein